MRELPWGIHPSKISIRLNPDHPRSPTAEQIRITLDCLNLNAAEFFEGVESGFHPELTLADIMAEQPRQFPKFCQQLRKPATREYDTHQLFEMASHLEELRMLDPDAAYRQALDVLRTLQAHPEMSLCDDSAAEAWGVLGVIQRRRGNYATAAGSYLRARALASSPNTKAWTYRRIGLFLSSRCTDVGEALRPIIQARNLFLEAGTIPNVARTFVDEAVVHCHFGNHSLARDFDQKALIYLATDDVEHRFAAIHGIAMTSALLGETALAVDYLDQTADFPTDRPLMNCSLHWLRAEILWNCSEFNLALKFLKTALNIAEEHLATRELLLLQLRIAYAYYQLNNLGALREILQELIAVHHTIHEGRPLYTLLGEFLRAAVADDVLTVTSDLLDATCRDLQAGATFFAAPVQLISN